MTTNCSDFLASAGCLPGAMTYDGHAKRVEKLSSDNTDSAKIRRIFSAVFVNLFGFVTVLSALNKTQAPPDASAEESLARAVYDERDFILEVGP